MNVKSFIYLSKTLNAINKMIFWSNCQNFQSFTKNYIYIFYHLVNHFTVFVKILERQLSSHNF